jgi:hypothetical protein
MDLRSMNQFSMDFCSMDFRSMDFRSMNYHGAVFISVNVKKRFWHFPLLGQKLHFKGR